MDPKSLPVPTPFLTAIALLEECGSQLQRTGGMVNKDLAKEVAKFVLANRPAVHSQAAEA